MFFRHCAVWSPNTDCAHRHIESFPRWLNKLSVTDWHWLGKCSFKHSCYGCYVSRAEADGMLLDACIGRINEKSFQIFNVLFESYCYMSVRPINFNVCGMAFMQACPFLITEHSVIK